MENIEIAKAENVIPESNIVIFSPHYDDVLFMLGGYILSLKNAGSLDTKSFDIKLVFPRSNYQIRETEQNADTSLKRIMYATGIRLLEDLNCLNDLIGPFAYRYELLGETECFARGKTPAAGKMEFPHGMFEDFDALDHEIFSRMKKRIGALAQLEDTALVFPMAIKEHIDHFIVREAALAVSREMANQAKATFYFQEDKPYGGLADEAELRRMNDFVEKNDLKSVYYAFDSEKVIGLAYRHYQSQMEELYQIGINKRAKDLQTLVGSATAIDRICRLDFTNHQNQTGCK